MAKEKEIPETTPIEPDEGAIYAGVFRHSMDGKNRVTIPSRWRRSEEDVFFCVPDQNGGFLRIIPPEEMNAISAKVMGDQKLSPQDKRIWRRGFYSRAQHLSADRQGRILLPEDQCEAMGITGDVVLVGVDREIEIWNPGDWQEASDLENRTYQHVANLVGV